MKIILCVIYWHQKNCNKIALISILGTWYKGIPFSINIHNSWPIIDSYTRGHIQVHQSSRIFHQNMITFLQMIFEIQWFSSILSRLLQHGSMLIKCTELRTTFLTDVHIIWRFYNRGTLGMLKIYQLIPNYKISFKFYFSKYREVREHITDICLYLQMYPFVSILSHFVCNVQHKIYKFLISAYIVGLLTKTL